MLYDCWEVMASTSECRFKKLVTLSLLPPLLLKACLEEILVSCYTVLGLTLQIVRELLTYFLCLFELPSSSIKLTLSTGYLKLI